MPNCPFCSCETDRLIAQSPAAIALFDRFPVTQGHALVVPRKHVASFYDLTASDQADLWQLAATVRSLLINQFGLASFNIGINDGHDAGQTIAHAHIHLIPRRPGDVLDPRGGLRWIIPEKARYWD